MTVGVLALQGDFDRHKHQLGLLGAEALDVRSKSQLDAIDGLIIPGGESTTMDKLMDRFALRQPLREFCESKPVWGTCAGMIMLAKHIEDNQAGVTPLGLLDIDVVRNGYGRQVFSFEEDIKATLGEHDVNLHATFIRAPRVTRCGERVRRLAEYRESPVLIAQQNIMACSFHTELDDDTTLLAHFLKNYLLSQEI